MNFTGISDCELLVMKCLWTAEQPVSVYVLISELDKQYGKEYKETTVYNFLSNLRKQYAQVMRSFWGDRVLGVLIDSMIFPEGSNPEGKAQIERLLKHGN